MAKISLCQTSTKFNILGYRANVAVGTRVDSRPPRTGSFSRPTTILCRAGADGGIDVRHVTAIIIIIIEVIDDH